MKLIVGLGNPGPKYFKTRHNIGFDVLDQIASRETWTARKKIQGLTCDVGVGDRRITLLKPQTFMNKSGVSVAALLRMKDFDLDSILVVHDDLDLPLGKLKIKQGGSDAGHNGLKDISSLVGRDYVRLRVGIGRPYGRQAVVDYVLSRFGPDEQEELDRSVIPTAVDAIDMWQNQGLEETQRWLHSR